MDEIEDRLRSLESEKIEPNIYETEEKTRIGEKSWPRNC